MSDERLIREQQNTNFLLAFIAGSLISVPGWLSGAIDVAFWLFFAGVILWFIGAAIWHWCDRSWYNLTLLLGASAGAIWFLSQQTFN